MNMDIPFIYEIRVEGHLPDHWSQWLEGLEIYKQPNGESILRGALVDQAALFGVLSRIHDLNLNLISVQRLSAAASKQLPEKS
jgi:hypothetical protein